MNSFWRALSEEHGGTLYRQASGQHTIEVTDEFLVPVVRVVGKDGASSEFKLEALDAEFSDEINKFFDLNTGDEIVQGEFNDRALEKHLSIVASEGSKECAEELAEEEREERGEESSRKEAASEEAQEWISKKIKHLIENEGKTQEQAAGQAHSMAREKGFDVPEKKSEAKHSCSKCKKADCGCGCKGDPQKCKCAKRGGEA